MTYTHEELRDKVLRQLRTARDLAVVFGDEPVAEEAREAVELIEAQREDIETLRTECARLKKVTSDV